jgi:ligand-binding sensor domain-containing protein
MSMARHAVSAIGLLLVCCPWASALNPALDVSQYAHTSWKFRDGFAKREIYAMAQTSDGYLWLGTGSGLFRFDGVRAVAWQPPNDQPLPSSNVLTLVAARDGTLWIGTRNGLASWKNGRLTQYQELAGLQINALLEDHTGSMWVGAFGLPNGKLCEIRNGNVQCYPEMSGLGSGAFGLHEDDKGNLWVGLTTGLWRWRPGPPKFCPLTDLNGIQGMADGEDSALLIPTAGGVLRLKDEKLQMMYRFPVSLRDVPAHQILRDRDRGFWVGTVGGGIVHLRQGRTDVSSRSDGLTGDTISSLFEDREGNIWATTADGLDRFSELPVVTYSASQGFAKLSGAILAATDGSVWFGTN